MKLSDFSLCQTDLTQDHEGQEGRSKIMNNRTEQLIQLISKVHSMYLGPKIFEVHMLYFRPSAWKLIEKSSRRETS